MCHLSAYIGDRPIAPLLLGTLRLQEGYFGGQATGMATLNDNKISIGKRPGPVDHVEAHSGIMSLTGTTGIAHSRYSLNVLKGPEHNTAAKAHPWPTPDGGAAMMHNGVINNYKEHWSTLKEEYTFTSYSLETGDITDSEVAVYLLDQKLKQGMRLPDALRETANSLTGMVLLVVLSADEPETVYIANWMQACTLGKGDGETIFTSSRLGLASLWDEFDVFSAPRNSLIKLTRDRVEISKLDPNRNAPDPKLDEDTLLRHSLRLLKEKGVMDSVGLLLALAQGGWEEVFGLDRESWLSLYRAGWEDQNQVMEPLAKMAEEGLIRKKVRPRLEGGVEVPRVFWSAP
ncbi:hypothetical protein KAW53_02745 [Candidatus Bathyarchaeota archaeon]|nr:hypothetical protein [Candidatus Bathyarchaeota archaeon]